MRSTICTLLAGAIFLIDTQVLPLGVAGAVLYVGVVLIAQRLEPRRHVLYVASAVSVLTILGYFLSEPGGVRWMVAANRSLALFAIWTTAIVIYQIKKVTELREQHSEELEQQVGARTAELRSQANRLSDQSVKLARHENRFRTLADNVPALFAYIDRDQRYRYVNRQYEAFWGRPASDIVGETVSGLLGPGRFERARSHIERALAGEEVTYETGFHLEDGRQTMMQAHFVPDHDVDGQVMGFFALITDITALKRAEDAVRESEQRLSLALREADGGVWDWDLTRDEAWWSPEMYLLWGIEPGTRMTLENSLAVICEQDRERVRGALEEALAADGKYRLEFRIRHAIEGERWMASRGSVVSDSSGRAVRMRGITLDITARKRAEEASKESGERMRAVLNTAADAIITIDQRGIIVDVNPATERLFGYSQKELVGQNVSVLMPAPYHHEHDGYIARYLETGEAQIIGIGREVEARRKDGTNFPIDLAVSQVEHLGLFTGVIRDISDRKVSEQEIKKHRNDLQRMSSELMLTEERERRQLAQDLHDGLGQALFLVNRKLPDTSLGDPVVAEIRTILDEAAQTVNALTFELSPPILHDLGLRPAIKWLARDLKKRYGLSVHIEDDGQPLEVDDRVAVTVFRSVRELLINTAKHARTDIAVVRFGRADKVMQITVEDHGTGFDPDAQSGQVEAGHFGLFSIRERMEYLAGTLAIRSAPGEGATMTLRVPLATGKAATGSD